MQTVDTHLKVFFTMAKKLDYINTMQLLRVDKSKRDHYYFFKIHTIDHRYVWTGPYDVPPFFFFFFTSIFFHINNILQLSMYHYR